MAKLIINIPDETRNDLEKMSEATGLSMNSLARMAVQSLIANYELNGTLIFAGLLNPDYKIKKSGD